MHGKEIIMMGTVDGNIMKILHNSLNNSNAETTQTARATVGAGTIIVRDNPNADISALNRDISQALTEEVVRNTNTRLDPLFSYVDRAFSYTGLAFDILKTPEKSGGGGTGNTSVNSTVPNPVKYIGEKFKKFYEDIQIAWGIKDKAQKP